jgi:SAM-dependent methyltransferase
MCNLAVIEFFMENVKLEEFEGRRVLEVGSKYVNGSVRPLIERFFKPKEYVGIDIEPGKFVDMICPVRITEYFGELSFEVVIATELLEHVVDWRLAIGNMKAVLKPNGYIYITTRSQGYHYHAFPYDFWRYELEDMKMIFSDFEIITLKRDHQEPGIFLKAMKPANWKPADLSNITLYSMILGRRTKTIPELSDMPLFRRAMLSILNTKLRWLLPAALLNLLERRFAINRLGLSESRNRKRCQ